MNPTLALIAGVNNGWDNLKGPGGPKTGELGIAYTGSAIAVTAQGYSGMERYSNALWSAVGDSPAGHRALVDVVATLHATPKLTFVGNLDTARQTAVPLLDATGNGAKRRSRWRTHRRRRSCSASRAAPAARTTPVFANATATLGNAMQSLAAQVLVKF